MRLRILTGAALLLGLAASATSGDSRAPQRQWAVAYLSEPTFIGSTIVQGPVLFTHDEAKMARGEPCTTVQLFDPAMGPMTTIAAFHCVPMRRPVVRKFTVRTQPNVSLGFGCVLTEYQFAGDSEAHGVPESTNAH